MKVNDVLCCSIGYWYKHFQNITIKSVIIPLTDEALNYFKESGTVVIPEEASKSFTSTGTDDEEDWEDDPNLQEAKVTSLKEFTKQINTAISSLDGKVFPKFTWNSPKDSSWLSSSKTLCCYTAEDVYLYLKCSALTTQNLLHPFQGCDDETEFDCEVKHCIAVRKWKDINPASEFRAFVCNNNMIGISQRDITQYFSHIKVDHTNICKDIYTFWKEKIKSKFTINSYAIDVYRLKKDEVGLIDFSPFGGNTAVLLFSWQELSDISKAHSLIDTNSEFSDSNVIEDIENSTLPEFRFISDPVGVQPGQHTSCGFPVDLVHLTSGEDPLKLVDFLQMKIQNQSESSDEDENT